jgi:hypothetical protein
MSWLALQVLLLTAYACNMPTLPSSLASLAPSFDKLQEVEIAAGFMAPDDDITWSFYVAQDSVIRVSIEPERQNIEFELADSTSTLRAMEITQGESSLTTAALTPGRYSVSFKFTPSLDSTEDDEADEEDCDEPYLRLHFYLKPRTEIVQMTSEELASSTEGYPDLSDLNDDMWAYSPAGNSETNYHIKLASLEDTQVQVLKTWHFEIPQPSDEDRSMGTTGLYKLTLTLRKD